MTADAGLDQGRTYTRSDAPGASRSAAAINAVIHLEPYRLHRLVEVAPILDVDCGNDGLFVVVDHNHAPAASGEVHDPRRRPPHVPVRRALATGWA